MISASNEQLQQQLEYSLLEPDCRRRWISKMHWGHLEERYAIKFCFRLGKMLQKHMECFRLLFDHLAWIKQQSSSGIRDSKKAGNLWGMMKGVGRVRKLIHQSWLAKRLGLRLRLLCWCFKGVQEEIPSEEASTLQIGSGAFPPGQYTRPQFNPCYRLFDQGVHQDSSSASLLSIPCSLWHLVITLSSQAIIMRELRRWKWLWRRSLTCSHKRTSMGPSSSCWNGRTSALQPLRLLRRGLEFHMCTINKSAYTKKSGKLFNDPRSLKLL